MPTNKPPRWVWPAVGVAVLAVALLLSNQTTTLPQSGSTAIMSDDEYVAAFKKADELSTSRIQAFEANQPLTADDKAKLREAGDLIDRIDAYKPQRASIFFASGQIHHILGEDDVAEERFRQCVLGTERQALDESQYAGIIRGTGAEAGYQLSLLLVNRRDFKGALEQADFAVKLDPQKAKYHTARASALNELRRTDEAKKELKIALALDPNDDRAKGLLHLLSH